VGELAKAIARVARTHEADGAMRPTFAAVTMDGASPTDATTGVLIRRR
jgi:hypothetical protein